jgi:hypothetical protein
MTREQISELNPHFYTTSSATYEGSVVASDGCRVNFLTKLTKDVERDSATADVTFLGLPSSPLAIEVISHIFFKMTENQNMLKNDHVLWYAARFKCAFRRQ